MIVLQYVQQSGLQNSDRGIALLHDTRPNLAAGGTQSFERITSRADGRYFTQLGLAEALRFRSQSSLKREQIEICESAFDTIQSLGLSELYIPAKEYFGIEPGLLGSIGFPDFVHHHLLKKDKDLSLLTDDARLRQYVGEAADRIVVVGEELAKTLGER